MKLQQAQQAETTRAQKAADLALIEAVSDLLEKRWKKRGSPACAVELWFQEITDFREGKLSAGHSTLSTVESVLGDGVDLLETWIADGKPATPTELDLLARSRARLAEAGIVASQPLNRRPIGIAA